MTLKQASALMEAALKTCSYRDWGSYNTYGQSCGTYWHNVQKVQKALKAMEEYRATLPKKRPPCAPHP